MAGIEGAKNEFRVFLLSIAADYAHTHTHTARTQMMHLHTTHDLYGTEKRGRIISLLESATTFAQT